MGGPTSRRSKSSSRHRPLADEIDADVHVSERLKGRGKKRKISTTVNPGEDDSDDSLLGSFGGSRISSNGRSNGTGSFRGRQDESTQEERQRQQQSHTIDSRTSRKILKIGQALQDEEREEEEARLPNPAFTLPSRFPRFSQYDAEEIISDEEREEAEAEAARRTERRRALAGLSASGPTKSNPEAEANTETNASGILHETYDGQDQDDDWASDVEVEEEELSPADLALFNKLHPGKLAESSVSAVEDPNTLSFNHLPLTSGVEEQNSQEQEQEQQRQQNRQQNQEIDLAALILEKIAAHESSSQQNGAQHTSSNLGAPMAMTDGDGDIDIDIDGQDHERQQERNHTKIHGGGSMEDAVELPAKVVEVYSKIGMLLSRYKSGALPKPFKILPTLPAWPTLLSITRPESWSANACFEATRVFISHKPAIAQEFLSSVILDRVRGDIHETKKLNVHLYNSLKKALYKPAAFFKGFLFPLVADGNCSLREAHIIGSVLVKVSIPVLHSAAALLRLTEIAAEQTSAYSTESAGATNIFIRILLDKKYALPYKVVDGLVFHFLRYRVMTDTSGAVRMDTTGLSNNSASLNINNMTSGNGANRIDSTSLASKEHKLPVLWHQCFLSFAQRYRNDITEDQREALLDLLLQRGHHEIGPEIRRELLEGRARGVDAPSAQVGDGGDDTMVF